MHFSKGLDLTYLFVNLYQVIFDVWDQTSANNLFSKQFMTWYILQQKMCFIQNLKRKSVKGMDDVSRDENNPCFSVNWRKFCTYLIGESFAFICDIYAFICKSFCYLPWNKPFSTKISSMSFRSHTELGGESNPPGHLCVDRC